MQYIVPCTVARPLAVFKDFLNQSIIKKSLDKIAALFVVRMLGKEGGDFGSVVFQCVAGAEKFGFFTILVVIRSFGTGVKIVVTGLQPCRACHRPVNGGLRRLFLQG